MPDNTPRLKKPFYSSAKWICFTFFLSALFLSLASTLELKRWPGFYISLMPGSDMEQYLSRGEGILDGTWPPKRPFYQAPLYSYAVALFIDLTESYLGIMIIQCILYALSVLFIVMTVCLEFGVIGAWIAGVLTLSYGGAMFYVSTSHSTVVEFFFSSWFLLAIVLWRRAILSRRDTGSENTLPKPFSLVKKRLSFLKLSWPAIFAGFLFSLLTLVRPNFMILLPFILAGIYYDSYTNKIPLRILLPNLFQFLFVIGSLFGIVMIRNNLYSDKLVFLTTNGALTYWIANSYDSSVFNFVYPKLSRMDPLDPVFWLHQVNKAIGYWWSYEYPQNVNFYLFKENSKILQLLCFPFAVIGSLTIMGSFLLLGKTARLWPYYSFFWIYYLTVVAFFITGRFRIPGLPAMLILATGGILELSRLWKNEKKSLVLGSLGLLGILFFAMKPFSKEIRLNDFYNFGYWAMVFGEPQVAETYGERAYKKSQSYNAGILWAQSLALQDKPAAALEVVTELNGKYPRDFRILKSRISLLRLTGDFETAAKLELSETNRQGLKSSSDAVLEGLTTLKANLESVKKKHWRILRDFAY